MLWIDAYAFIFKVISVMFKQGNIPTADALERALGQLSSKDMQKLVTAYGKQGAKLNSVLKAVVCTSKTEWEEEDFEAIHCHSKEWDALPACAEHDLNWALAEKMLTG